MPSSIPKGHRGAKLTCQVLNCLKAKVSIFICEKPNPCVKLLQLTCQLFFVMPKSQFASVVTKLLQLRFQAKVFQKLAFLM
jgi:hypothetical protein